MAKLTADQRKTLSKKVVGLPEKPKVKAQRMPVRSGYPGMSAGMDAGKMQSLASMGRC